VAVLLTNSGSALLPNMWPMGPGIANLRDRVLLISGTEFLPNMWPMGPVIANPGDRVLPILETNLCQTCGPWVLVFAISRTKFVNFRDRVFAKHVAHGP